MILKRIKKTDKRHLMVVFAPYPLGETRVQREAEALTKHGYHVDVICLRLTGETSVDSYKGVQIFREKYRHPFTWFQNGSLGDKALKYTIFFISAAFRLVFLHFQAPFSTIQVHNMPDFLVFCALIPKLLGVPIILDMHDLMPEFYIGKFGQVKSMSIRLIRIQEHLACWFANHVITVTELWRQALIQRGVPEDKCSVVMNVADENIFHRPNQIIPQPFTGKSFRLIYHGTFAKRNGLDLAIQAVDRVRQDIPGIHLFLIGNGDYLPDMVRMIGELGLDRHVTIEGLHLAEDLPEIILSCHLGIAPIRRDAFTDTALPTKLFEYAALGLPAITARTTVNQFYFMDANVEFFEPGDVEDLARTIRRLYLNPDRLNELAQACQQFNHKYNWDKLGSDYVTLVEKLRSEPKSPVKASIQQDLNKAALHNVTDDKPE
jgi:glycosyltransferase involved in cell wall biosynthesis